MISGYLIANIVFTELSEGRFSLIYFYERRVRRILPAFLFVVLASLPFAWIWMMPREMEDFSKSVIWASLFASNFYFWNVSGYFDTAAELRPFLHTWSLAVEEQFYIIFPAISLLLWRLGLKWALGVLALLALASLVLAQWTVVRAPQTAFYLPHTRAWELLLGALIALWQMVHPSSQRVTWIVQAAATAGLLMIIGPIFLFDRHTPFPGLTALLPTVGAGLVIVFGRKGTLAHWLLSGRLPVGIGLVSYSAYLWHQPLFAFARYRSISEPSETLMVVLALVTFLLAYATWRIVEMPFRSRQRVPTQRVAMSSAVLVASLACAGATGSATNGYAGRFAIPPAPPPWDEIRCHGRGSLEPNEEPLSACLGERRNGKTGDIFLVGDSHAAALTFPLRQLAIDRGRELFFINTEDEAHLPYVYWRVPVEAPDPLLRSILDVADPGDLLVITFHRGYLNEVRGLVGERDAHIELAQKIEPTARSTRFFENMRRNLAALDAAGIKVVLLKDTPLMQSWNVERCAFFGKAGSDRTACAVDRVQDEHTRTRQERVFDALADSYKNVRTLDPLPSLYNGSSHFDVIRTNGTYRMLDKHHLTQSEAMRLYAFFSNNL